VSLVRLRWLPVGAKPSADAMAARGGAIEGVGERSGVDGATVPVGLDLVGLIRRLRADLAQGAAGIELDVPDPDRGDEVGAMAGGWRAWFDLAEGLGCRLEAPRSRGGGRAGMRLVPLPPEAAWHAGGAAADGERYADPAGFGAVRKLEHPGFLLPLLEALERLRPPDGGRVLVLGCHRGDEIAALGLLEPAPAGLDVVGVDRSAGALAEAAARFPAARFMELDVADLPPDLGRFDLVVAIALLQRPDVDDRALVRRLVQQHLAPAGGLLLGLPNGRFRGAEPVWGARTRNYREPDLSLVVRDLAAYRRYLHQHGFRTHVGGRYDLLLSAWRSSRPGGAGRERPPAAASGEPVG